MGIARKYPKQVFWSDEDEGFIAIAPDLPGCSAFGDSEADALAELDHAIEAWIDSAKAAGNNIPAPSSPAPRAHSGRLLVRMPRSLHQELADGAQREGVSLNQFIIFVLSRYFSRSVSVSGAENREPPATTKPPKPPVDRIAAAAREAQATRRANLRAASAAIAGEPSPPERLMVDSAEVNPVRPSRPRASKAK